MRLRRQLRQIVALFVHPNYTEWRTYFTARTPTGSTGARGRADYRSGACGCIMYRLLQLTLSTRPAADRRLLCTARCVSTEFGTSAALGQFSSTSPVPTGERLRNGPCPASGRLRTAPDGAARLVTRRPYHRRGELVTPPTTWNSERRGGVVCPVGVTDDRLGAVNSESVSQRHPPPPREHADYRRMRANSSRLARLQP